MPQNGCCIFEVGQGGRGDFAGHFQSLTAQCPAWSEVWVLLGQLGSFLLAKQNFFLSLALERLQQQSSEAFRGELVLARDQGEEEAGEDSVGTGGEGEGCSSSAPHLGKGQRKPTCFICCRQGTNTRDSPASHLFA